MNDYDAMGAIAAIAYPWGGEGPAALADRYRTTHPQVAKTGKGGAPDRVPAARERWVVERDGAVVAMYTDLALEYWLGGRACTARGLSGVTVAPEARKSGVARAILAHHVGRARAAGAAWSLCYAYSPDFYARFGWSSAGRSVRWRASPSELPLYAERTLAARIDLGAPGNVERIDAAYRLHCTRTNGSLSRPASSVWRVAGGEHDFVVAVAGADGALRGYAIGSYRATPAQQTLVVPELIAHDPESRRALVGFLAAQRDQADALEIDTAEGDALGAVIERRASRTTGEGDPEDHRRAGVLFDGLLARIVDLPVALARRGYAKGAAVRVAFHADDVVAPGNASPVVVAIDGGRARVSSRVAREPVVRGTIEALARIVTGALRFRDAVDYGTVRMERASARAVDAVDAAFALPTPYAVHVF